MIGAIVRAQLLSMRLGSRGSVLSAVTGLLWYGFWGLLASVACVFTAGAGPAVLHRDAPMALLLVFLYWQLIPVFSASMGSGLDLRKLLPYPVPQPSKDCPQIAVGAVAALNVSPEAVILLRICRSILA